MKIFDMPCTGKHFNCTKHQEYRLRFMSREDAIEQANKFIEEIINKYDTSGYFYYNYTPVSDVQHDFRFSVAINERTEYDGRGLGHILNDGILSVYYDPGVTFSYVTVDYRLVLKDDEICGD